MALLPSATPDIRQDDAASPGRTQGLLGVARALSTGTGRDALASSRAAWCDDHMPCSDPGDPLIVFLHLSKTGGTTLGHLFLRNFAPCEMPSPRAGRFPRWEPGLPATWPLLSSEQAVTTSRRSVSSGGTSASGCTGCFLGPRGT